MQERRLLRVLLLVCGANGIMSSVVSIPGRCCPQQTLEKRSEPLVVPRVLVGLVTGMLPSATRLLLENIYALREYPVSWAVALYDGDDGSGMDDVRSLAAAANVSFEAFDARASEDIPCPFCAKLELQLSFLRYLEKGDYFDYVLLPDADLSFRDFDWRRYWELHAAAGSPLVSQPAAHSTAYAGTALLRQRRPVARLRGETHEASLLYDDIRRKPNCLPRRQVLSLFRRDIQELGPPPKRPKVQLGPRPLLVPGRGRLPRRRQRQSKRLRRSLRNHRPPRPQNHPQDSCLQGHRQENLPPGHRLRHRSQPRRRGRSQHDRHRQSHGL